tara:strand:- start:81 stop:1073 length:993 start_codon:yes stop_codon:yes gene_type:complete
LKDNRITADNKLEFNKIGWTLIDLKLSEESIFKAQDGLSKMKRLSIKNNYRPRRIYYDHFFTNNKAAIELPFNNEICNLNIKNFFKEARIGSLVKTLMGWENTFCDLARLFCMGNYKYRGNWHRDYNINLNKIQNDSNQRDVVLAAIYLLPQRGFRILKKDYEFNGTKSIIKNHKTDNAIRSFPYPLSPPNDSYYEINGKIGTALLFDPLLLHQGSNFSSRLDFHMKFCNSKNNIHKKNDFQDFSVTDILSENYKLPVIDFKSKDINLKSIPYTYTKSSTIAQKLSNSIDYRTCLRKFFKVSSVKNHKNYNLIKSQGWELDFFSNTIFQR